MVNASQPEPNLIKGGASLLVPFPSRKSRNVHAGVGSICRKDKRRRAKVKVGGCRGVRRERPPVLWSHDAVLSDWSEGVAFAQRLILLGVERLPLQVDLAEL